MNVSKLIKLAPTLVLLGAVGYVMTVMESAVPEAAERQAELQKGLDRIVHEVIADGSSAAVKLEGKLRDPFWLPGTTKAAKAEAEAKEAPPPPPPADELAEAVRGMSLGATLVQGKEQLAVIDGRIYTKGQKVAIPVDDPASGRSLEVAAVTRIGVVFKAGDRNYHLGYPDQFGKKKEAGDGPEAATDRALAEIDPTGQMEMFQRLLNSPVGAMGRGLIGDAAGRGRSTGPAARARPRGPG